LRNGSINLFFYEKKQKHQYCIGNEFEMVLFVAKLATTSAIKANAFHTTSVDVWCKLSQMQPLCHFHKLHKATANNETLSMLRLHKKATVKQVRCYNFYGIKYEFNTSDAHNLTQAIYS